MARSPRPGALSAPRCTGVRSLVLADTYAGWKGSLPEPIPEERLAACLRDASLPPAEFVPKYLPGMFGASPTPEVRDELARIMSDFHPVGFRLMATALAHADTRDLLPTIDVPTLLVWGDADARSPMTVAHQLHEAIPGSRLAVMAGAGHVTNLEQPAQFNAEVRDFCLSVSDKVPGRLNRRDSRGSDVGGGQSRRRAPD